MNDFTYTFLMIVTIAAITYFICVYDWPSKTKYEQTRAKRPLAGRYTGILARGSSWDIILDPNGVISPNPDETPPITAAFGSFNMTGLTGSGIYFGGQATFTMTWDVSTPLILYVTSPYDGKGTLTFVSPYKAPVAPVGAIPPAGIYKGGVVQTGPDESGASADVTIAVDGSGRIISNQSVIVDWNYYFPNQTPSAPPGAVTGTWKADGTCVASFMGPGKGGTPVPYTLNLTYNANKPTIVFAYMTVYSITISTLNGGDNYASISGNLNKQ